MHFAAGAVLLVLCTCFSSTEAVTYSVSMHARTTPTADRTAALAFVFMMKYALCNENLDETALILSTLLAGTQLHFDTQSSVRRQLRWPALPCWKPSGGLRTSREPWIWDKREPLVLSHFLLLSASKVCHQPAACSSCIESRSVPGCWQND